MASALHSPLSLPVLVTAGMMFYAAVSHALLIRRQRGRADLLFAMSCFAMGLYDLFCAGLYSAQSPAEGAVWQRAQVATLAFVSVFFVGFVAEYTGRVRPAVLRGLTAYFAASGLLAAAGGWLVLRLDHPMPKPLSLPFGLQTVYYEVAPGPLLILQSAVGLATLAYLFLVCLRFYREADPAAARPLLIALGIFLAAAVHDTAVSGGLYRGLYTIEYGYVGMVLVMSATLSRAVVQTDAALTQLAAVEKRFESLFRTVTVGMAMTAPDGRVRRANAALGALFGHGAGALEGGLLVEHFHADDREAIRVSLADLLQGDIAAYRDERRFVLPSGRAGWADLSAGLLRDPAGEPEAVVWIVMDITERREAVQALQFHNEQLEQRIAERTAQLQLANQSLSDTLSRLESDEAAAQMIQFNLLPEDNRHILGLEFSRLLRPSTHMSGDFVDYFEVGSNRVGFYMADVSGHGVSSAFVTVLLKSFMSRLQDLYAENGDPTLLDPGATLERMNRELRLQDHGKHVTVFYAVADTAADTFAYASAGHFPYPVLVHAGGRETLCGRGAPVGLFETSRYEAVCRSLPPEFVLAAFSDGVLDGLPAAPLREKQERLAALLDGPDLSVGSLADRVGLTSGQSPPDDATILLVRRRAAHA